MAFRLLDRISSRRCRAIYPHSRKRRTRGTRRAGRKTNKKERNETRRTAKKAEARRASFPVSRAPVCRKSLVCGDIGGGPSNAPNRDARVCSRTFARCSPTGVFPSCLPACQLASPPVSRSLRYPRAAQPRSRTHVRSYAHTRAHTPCTSQISTLHEHTNKPPSHVCT